ncbi:ATP-binding protein [Streptomyces mobaraensis]|nr:AAA family ATPase [Streptomyces sp. TYQ1024]UBI35668.1 ATP-binding protein [Streptomyces mobaraensis]
MEVSVPHTTGSRAAGKASWTSRCSVGSRTARWNHRPYPEHTYFERERPVVDAVRRRLAEHLAAGDDVVLDHGLWLREDRDAWKKLVEAAGGRCRLVYLSVEKDELLRRLADRNRREDANALTVSPQALDDFLVRFEPPAPDEGALVYAGDLDAVLAPVG